MISVPIILASASPRRSQLLKALGFEFKVVPSSADELHDQRLSLAELCTANATRKAGEVALRFPESLVIGADTLVALNGKLFGKPLDLDQAHAMLLELSGHTHEVVTGVCLAQGAQIETFSDRTEVTFRKLTSAAIEHYISSGPVLDKAGAYGIQQRGEMLVERISGSFDNVMGFPTEKFLKRIKSWETTP